MTCPRKPHCLKLGRELLEVRPADVGHARRCAGIAVEAEEEAVAPDRRDVVAQLNAVCPFRSQFFTEDVVPRFLGNELDAHLRAQLLRSELPGVLTITDGVQQLPQYLFGTEFRGNGGALCSHWSGLLGGC